MATTVVATAGYVCVVRHLHQQDLPASVAATSRILKLPGWENKTDRIDSKKLAQYAAKGLLKPIQIPTLQQEADRQLYRMRHRQSRNLAKVKTQIKSFLLMHDNRSQIESKYGWPMNRSKSHSG